MRTFEEILSTIATITGVPTTNPEVEALYQNYVQQLPSVEAIDAFLPSHQMAIAQLAITSCSELVNCTTTDTSDPNHCTKLPGDYFSGFNFDLGAQDAFVDYETQRRRVIDPLLTAVMNVDTATPTNNLDQAPDDIHPGAATIRDLLGATTTQHLRDLDDPLDPEDDYESLITQLVNAHLIPVPALPPDNSTARTAKIVKAVCGATVAGAVMLIQ